MKTDNIRKRLTGVNVPPTERVGTGVLGVIATLFGVKAILRRSPLGWLLAAIGALVGGRAASGRCAGYRALAGRGERKAQ
jgi:hypothetical protein